MRDRLIEIFDEIPERDDIRVAVLTRETGNAIHECQNPVIAAVNGVALGAGLGLMAVSDIFIASEEVTTQLAHTEDAKEARAAMLEKRKPEFKGR